MAAAFSAANSVISGTGISGPIVAFTTYTIIVTAKDSSGNNIGVGGKTIYVEIYNKCTMDTRMNCVFVTGSKQTLSNYIRGTMTDNGNGTYSYSYSVSQDGIVSIVVKLEPSGILNARWYNNNYLGEPAYIVNTVSNLFLCNCNNLSLPGLSNYFTGKITGKFKAPTTETFTFNMDQDDCSRLAINGVYYINRNFYDGVCYDSFTIQLTANTYYDILYEGYNGPAGYSVAVYWSSPSIFKVAIPSSAFVVPEIIGSSPIQVTVVCPTGYTGNDASSLYACKEICGDGLRVGVEVCDDANIVTNDGCQSNCASITSGYVCSGGSTTSKDICIQCTTGFYQNAAKTLCVTHCGDGIKAGTEGCDDANTVSNDGCSSTCVVETGYKCVGGSLTSADTCTKCPNGYYTDLSNTSQCITQCGDGFRAGSEVCDDGNTVAADGCESTCLVITNQYVCSGGTPTTKDTCILCGNGLYQNALKSVCEPHCGDNIRAGTEGCDDGNLVNNDGCSSVCVVESGFFCTVSSDGFTNVCSSCDTHLYTDLSNTAQCIPQCGDGYRTGTEKCDDGGTANGDGCSADCSTVENGYKCSGGGPYTKDTCTLCDVGFYTDYSDTTRCIPRCGDNRRAGTEKCDDGNTVNGDGCNSDCSSVETGFKCSGGTTTSKDVCTACDPGYYTDLTDTTRCITKCGDGLRVGTEKCDDGNTVSGDGCNNICANIEIDYKCSGGNASTKDTCVKCDPGYHTNPSDTTQCIIVCGDGLRAGTEKCDDGNTSNGDGCKSDCSSVETGYKCSGGTPTSSDSCIKCANGYYTNLLDTTQCITKCGDGLKAGIEKCDDGNTSNGDGCKNDCSSVEIGFMCSGGTPTSKDSCIKCANGYYTNLLDTTQCIAKCGDGFRAGTEKCDDGNTSNGDGCKNDCSSVETGFMCSGGTPTSKDACSKCSKGFYTNLSDTTQCITKCGDGIRVGKEKCDDGNTIANDGCASDCLSIDDGYVCTGGEYGITDVCFECDMGYDPNGPLSQCVGATVPLTSEAMAVAAIYAASAGISTNIIIAMFTSTSSSGSSSYGMLNQIQLVILLPMLQTYMPDKLYDYLKSMKAGLFNADFLPIGDSGTFTDFKNLFDFPQVHTYLKLLGLTSGSAFVNILNLTVIIGAAVCIHILLIIIFAILYKVNRLGFIRRLVVKLLESFTFGFYIGIYIQTYILFVLVTFSEIYFEKLMGSRNSNSTKISYTICAFMGVTLILTFWQWCKSRKQEQFERQKYFKGLVDGMRPNWICRSYFLVFFIRRTIFGALVFFGINLEMITRVALFTSVQFLLMVYIIILRPQESVKEQISDIINEVLYLYYSAFLLYYNVEERWNDTVTDVYFWILMANNIILILITIISIMLMIIKLIKNKCSRSKVDSKENIQNNTIQQNRTTRNLMNLNKTYTQYTTSGRKDERIEEEKGIYFSKQNDAPLRQVQDLNAKINSEDLVVQELDGENTNQIEIEDYKIRPRVKLR